MNTEKQKVYAVTLNPEDFDYRVYDIREDEGNDVIIDGGRQFIDVDEKGYLIAAKKAISGYNSWDFEYYYHNSIMAHLKDYLPKKENGKRLSPKDAHNIKMSIECWNNDKLSYEDVVCDILNVITGQLWKHTGLRGCCQGDYVVAYYPVREKIKEYLDWVEAWYFGTGTEVMVHEEENTPEKAEDISGWTFYTAEWKPEKLKKEIKEWCGYKADDDNIEVVLWLYDKTRTIRIDEFKLAD